MTTETAVRPPMIRNFPVERVALGDTAAVIASYTLKGQDHHNDNFSFRRPNSGVGYHTDSLDYNLLNYGNRVGFDPQLVTWPNGNWPHTGKVIIAERTKWLPDAVTDGHVPVKEGDVPIQYDGIVTQSTDFVLGVQGADCSAVYFYDPVTQTIGLAHCGWKPVVRGVVANMIRAMIELRVDPANLQIVIGPGAGDTYNEFKFGSDMEDYVKAVFVEAERIDLTTDARFIHEMTPDEKEILAEALDRPADQPPESDYSFMLTSVITCELTKGGVPAEQITAIEDSTIIDPAYHSFRRDKGPNPKRPNHGLNLSTIFLKPAA